MSAEEERVIVTDIEAVEFINVLRAIKRTLSTLTAHAEGVSSDLVSIDATLDKLTERFRNGRR
jgi:hypothetical protein